MSVIPNRPGDGSATTGPMQIGDGQPGLFICAEDVRELAPALKGVIDRSSAHGWHLAPVRELLRQIRACNPTPKGRY